MAFKNLPKIRNQGATLFFQLLPVFLVLLVFSSNAAAQDAASDTWWSEAAQRALLQSGTNRMQLVTALQKAPLAHRDELQFLIENAPLADLQALSSDFLLENLALADEAFASAPWREKVAREIFLNDVLPYACVNETRDNWRKMLRNICAPLVADCKTPGEAAGRLNEKVFKIVNVHYSTARKKADQSPAESMENGLASCTGLSILLVDACRSVGIPARIAGTPMWSNLRGNHTWVEVWDNGWHFLGASEPDPKGLDHAWFEHDAAEAVPDSKAHAIYAASFKKTGLEFPLDWASEIHWVNAVNVTERYLPKNAAVAQGKVRLAVKVVDAQTGRRIAARVIITSANDKTLRLEGSSRDESADMNNLLSYDVMAKGSYKIRAELGGFSAEQVFTPGINAEALVSLSLGEVKPLKPRDETRLKKALAAYFIAPEERQAGWKFSGSLEKLLRENEPAVRQIAWEVYKAAPIHDALKHDFDAKRCTFQNNTSPFTMKYVGQRPVRGWALFIAMHGGGGVEKEVNDQQWKVMETHYKEHPEAGGYIYLALRAPNDTWNGFYDDYIYPLVANLVHEFLIFGDVDPDKVFIMGYSHGGYGAFAIGPKEPDLFAAIHASAAAPTDGETSAKTLRNTVFTCMVGETDTAYDRRQRDEKFRDLIASLRGDRTDIFPVKVEVATGFAHSNLNDRDQVKEMYPAVRNPVPHELTWELTDKVITDFFWLHTDMPGKNCGIDADCRENFIGVTTSNLTSAVVYLDSRMVDFSKPVTFDFNDRKTVKTLQPSLRTVCETLRRRNDPGLAFTTEVHLPFSEAIKNK